MNLKVLDYEVERRVGVVTLNHPPVNALGVPFLEDFERILDLLQGSGDTRALLIRSACPGFFSAGDDLESLRDLDERVLDMLPRAHAVLDAIEALPMPTVACVNGQALGGGLELALVCDFRFLDRDTGRMGLPEIRLGMIPALGGTQRLTQIVGRAKGLEMMIKGRLVDPDEALDCGLVNATKPTEELEGWSLDFAARLAQQATEAIAHIKRCVHVGLAEGAAAGMAAERQAFRQNILTNDAREGVAAFLEGRKPVFGEEPADGAQEESRE